MSIRFERAPQGAADYFAAAQEFVGRVIEASFGYTTSPELNALLVYAGLLFLVVLAGRVRGTRPRFRGHDWANGSDAGYNIWRNR
ncbi:MAG: hypothetical protein ACE5FS_09180 [Paracoccaceae bacterium]